MKLLRILGALIPPALMSSCHTMHFAPWLFSLNNSSAFDLAIGLYLLNCAVFGAAVMWAWQEWRK